MSRNMQEQGGMPKTEQQRREDSEYAHEAVPQSARKGFWPLFAIMLGFTFFSASMSVGANLGNGLDLTGFIWAVFIGGTILGAYTGVLAFIGGSTGLSLDLLANRSFGTMGSLVPSSLIAATQIGWFGVGVAMFAIPTAELLHINTYALVLASGLLMTATCYFGIRGVEIVSMIAVPLIAVLGTWSMVSAAAEGGGLAAVFARSTGKMTLFTGIGLVIGSFVSGGTTTPNFVRFAKTRLSAVVTTVIAFFFGNSLMFAFGAVGGAFTGKDDIFYIFIAQGLALPAIAVLGANIWTTNNNALYSAGLGLDNITKLHGRTTVLAAGVAGTLAAVWLYNNFVAWLSLLNATLPPIGAIIAMDFFLHRAEYAAGTAVTRKVNWGAVLGVAAGALAGNLVPVGITAVNAMAVACLCNLAVKKLFPCKAEGVAAEIVKS